MTNGVRSLFLCCSLAAWIQWGYAEIPTGAQILERMDQRRIWQQNTQIQMRFTKQREGKALRINQGWVLWKPSERIIMLMICFPTDEKGTGFFIDGDARALGCNHGSSGCRHINYDLLTDAAYIETIHMALLKWAELYDAEAPLRAVLYESIPVYQVHVTVKHGQERHVDYPRKTFWVRQDTFELLQEESYSRAGELMETRRYADYVSCGAQSTPFYTHLINQQNQDDMTIEFLDLNIANVSDDMFTERWLNTKGRGFCQ